MRYLILSDLHSNREALEAVLTHANGHYDRVVCCGDLVGYGPDPNAVIDWARENFDAVIRGNHDRACAGLDSLEWFNPVAKAASLWTLGELSASNLDYLRALPTGPLAVDCFQLIHGSPLDEDEYVMSIADARNVFSYLDVNVTFFGHTHVQGGFVRREGQYQMLARPDAGESGITLRLHPAGTWLINPGSTGQPRDRDPRAAYAIFDNEAMEVTYRRVHYDFDTTRRKILESGLPEVLGSRLTIGR